jgi:hypothetical protein
LLEYYALASRDVQVRRRVRSYIGKYVELLTQMLREAIRRGECRPVNPQKTALSIDALYEGLTVLWLADIAHFNLEQMVSHTTALILRALLPN